MDRDWLAERIAEGLSLEAIARECGKAASTVAYWINKHGLVAAGAGRHAPKGALEEAVLRELVERGLSIREIARELDRSPTAVRHWLRRFGLITSRTRGEASPEPVVVRTCPRHGVSEFVRYGAGDRHRCRRCRYEAVTDRRRRVKAILVEEAGGRCELCGYDRFLGALQFHHRDPATKAFNVSLNGHARALDRCREEVRKCALLCANCHAEVEWGAATLPA